MPELREKIAKYYNENFSGNYNAQNVLVTVGSTEGLASVLKTILAKDDEVIIPTPAYVGYEPLITISEAKTKFLDLEENDFVLTKEILEENGTLVEKPIFDESKIIGKEIEIYGNKLKIAKAPINSELTLRASTGGSIYLQAYVNEKTFANIVRNDERGPNFRGFYQSDLKGDKKIEDIMKKQQQTNLEKEYDFGKVQMFTETIITPAGVIGIIKGMITIFQLLLYGFLILVILMSVVNIFTTITINILLRSRELAILKSVGMSDKQFDKMLRGENYIACLRSIIFGTVVSLLLLFATKVIIDKGNVNIDFRFIADMLGSINYIALAISIILVYGITFVSTFFAKKSIRSQDIVEVIRRDNI